MLIDHGAALDDLDDWVEILNDTQDDMLADMAAVAAVVDGHTSAISGATISCDSSGVTLTWGT